MNPPAAAPGPQDHRTRTRRIVASSVVAVVALAIIAGATIFGSREPVLTDPSLGLNVGAAVSGQEAPTTRAPTTQKPAPVLDVTPVTEPPLPLPDPLPSDPYAKTPRIELGTLSIPKLGVKVTMLEGITLTAIDQGAGHWPGTPQPGELGNMVVAGHRTLYQKPFNRLNELVAGDKVIFTTSAGLTVTYAVRDVIVVPAASVGIASQFRSHTATLFACHPVGQATHRIVAKLALLGPDGEFVDPEDALPPLDVGLRDVDSTVMVRAQPGGGSGGGQDPLAGAGQ